MGATVDLSCACMFTHEAHGATLGGDLFPAANEDASRPPRGDVEGRLWLFVYNYLDEIGARRGQGT